VLVTPSPLVVGWDVTAEDRRRIVEQRRAEPWFPEAFAAFERIWSGEATPADWDGITPFMHGRWDPRRAGLQARSATERNADAAAAYYSDAALTPDATRTALTKLDAPVLLLAGEYDVALPPPCAATYAGLFPGAELAVQPGAGHYPWLDDPQGSSRPSRGSWADRPRGTSFTS
jgi:pimeloyl-ACP methyl ester carboxylesterase